MGSCDQSYTLANTLTNTYTYTYAGTGSTTSDYYIPGTSTIEATIYSSSGRTWADIPAFRNYNMPVNAPPVTRTRRVQYLADGAAARAEALLHSCLNDEQQHMLRVQHKFRVVSNLGNIFEICEGRMHNIYKLNMEGYRVENWCVLPRGELAQCDVMLAQKLWLETDEAETERCANITHVASGRLVRTAPVQYQPGIFVPELTMN